VIDRLEASFKLASGASKEDLQPPFVRPKAFLPEETEGQTEKKEEQGAMGSAPVAHGAGSPPGVFRTAHFNEAEKNHLYKYSNNTVVTAKYTKVNFIFKGLFEQFKRVANCYFLVISLLQIFTDFSPTSKFSTAAPLAAVLAATLTKEAFEDYARHKSDNEVNNRPAHVLRNGAWTEVKWRDIVVGDIVKCISEHEFPADLVLLASSEDQGMCYIETANLDGETNLKIRQALEATSHLLTPEQLSAIDAYVEYEKPNDQLYNFDGALHVRSDAFSGKYEKVSVDIQNVLLRGCTLRNTPFIYGFVVFTGKQTKLRMNANNVPMKRSDLEKSVNRAILLIFVTEFIICTLGMIFHYLFNEANKDTYYLPLQGRDAVTVWLGGWITFLILFNNFVPISLYVSLEFLKFTLAKYVNTDLDMYYAPNDMPALARTSNIMEDLGQIEYIFSDKTGTLTRNEMEFRKCYIDRTQYGFGTTEIGLAAAQRKNDASGAGSIDSEKYQNKERAQFHPDPKLEFDDIRLREAAEDPTNPNHERVHRFLINLSVCHTVIPEADKVNEGEIIYQAASPDEEALVKAARAIGYRFLTRTSKHITISVFGKEYKYEILCVNEFNSTRKRMSVICKTPEGKIMLMTKGADTVIFERLRKPVDENEANEKERLRLSLVDMAEEGLRTLVLGECELTPQVYTDWFKKYQDASTSIENREDKLMAVAEEIEQDFEIVGATAIEDKLQVGVPDAIATLAKAGMKIWVLTGDKQETAINIGFACRLLTQEMMLIIINGSTPEETRRQLLTQADRFRSIIESKGVSEELALIINGSSLGHVFSDEQMRGLLLKIGVICKAVVACRVSPKQKAQVVALVKDNVSPKPMTLAIGDGANDVSMIQTANVGIGISGNEGMQAVNSSDYAIGQFRYLVKLLLVHGRWNYQRVALTVLFSFYKNVAYVLTLVFFCIDNGWSGTTLYESVISLAWNIVTFAPVLVYGFFNQETSAEAALKYPYLYLTGMWKRDFGLRRMLLWILNGVLHAVIVYFICRQVFWDAVVSPYGDDEALFVYGTIVYLCLFLVVLFKLAIHSDSWTRLTGAGFWGSVLFVVVVLPIYSMIHHILSFFSDIYFIGVRIYGMAMLYLLLLLVPIAAVLIDYLVRAIGRNFFPNPPHIVQELEKKERGSFMYDPKKLEKIEVAPVKSHSSDSVRPSYPL